MTFLRPLLGPFAAWAVVAALTTLLWSWLGRPVALPDVPDGRFECLSYAPTTSEDHPLTGPDYKLPPGLIRRDLAILSRVTDCVRTYSSFGVQGQVLAAAAKLGMKVQLGIWIGTEEKRNKEEIDAALEVAARHPEAVRAIIVGNEVLLRREMSGERLAGIIRSVKARTKLPVAYADIFEYWENNPMVAEAVDRMLIHVLPYWDDPVAGPVEDAQHHVRGIIEHARKVFPKVPLEIGEIGWPSSGRTRGLAVPSRVNQARFIREFTAQAKDLNIRYNIVEAVDQAWKRGPEGTVGGFWGIIDAARMLKFPLSGPVREWRNSGLAAVFAALTPLLFLGLGRWRRPDRPSFLGDLGLASAGGATGVMLWMVAAQAQAITGGPFGTLTTVYLISITLGGGLLLAAQAAGFRGVAGRAPAPWAEVREGFRMLTVSPERALGLCRWLLLLPAAVLAMQLGLDGRHRDFLPLAFILPALAFAVQAWQARGRNVPHPAEDAWVTLILLICGPLAVDVPGDLEAMAWAGTCLLLALPGLPALGAELRRLGRRLAPVGQGD